MTNNMERIKFEVVRAIVMNITVRQSHLSGLTEPPHFVY